jgi:hypothetical protein
MQMKFGEKWLGILGLLIITIPTVPVKTVSAGLARAEPRYSDGKSGYTASVAYQDARIAEAHPNNIYIAGKNTNYFESNQLKNDGLYNDNIQIWILIVLIMLGLYTVVAGCFIYFHFWKPGSDKQTKSKTAGGIYPILKY